MPQWFDINAMLAGGTLAWVALVMGRTGMSRTGMGRTGSDCIALDHLAPRKRFTQIKKIRISKNPFCFQAPLLPWTATRNQKTSPEKKNSLTRY